MESSLDPALLESLGLNPVGLPAHDSSEFAEELRVQVESLPDDLREVIELLFWAHERPADIARMVGCSRPAVYDRVARALGELKEMRRV